MWNWLMCRLGYRLYAILKTEDAKVTITVSHTAFALNQLRSSIQSLQIRGYELVKHNIPSRVELY